MVVPLFWQKLSPTDYGIIAVTEMIGAILTVFLGLSLDSSITRFYYEWPEPERKRKVGAIWVASWISTIAFGAAGILVLSLTSNIIFPDVKFYPFIFLGLIKIILGSFLSVPFATFRIKQLSFLYCFFSILNFIINIGLSIYFVLIVSKGLYGYFIANIIGGAISVAVLFVIMLKFASPCIHGGGLRKSLEFSLPLIPSSIVSSVSSILDRFLLQQFASLKALGIYAVSLKFTNLIISAHTALKLSYVPFMVESVSKNKQKGSLDLARMSLFYVLPILMLGLTISAYIREFVYFANRAEYFSVLQWVPWLIGPAILKTLNVYFTPGLFLSKRTDLTWIPTTIQLIVVLSGGLLLIPRYQLQGVVIGRYFSEISFFVVSFILTEKFYPLPTDWEKTILLFVIVCLGIILLSILDLNNFAANILVKTSLLTVIGLVSLVIVVGLSPTGRVLSKFVARLSKTA